MPVKPRELVGKECPQTTRNCALALKWYNHLVAIDIVLFRPDQLESVEPDIVNLPIAVFLVLQNSEDAENRMVEDLGRALGVTKELAAQFLHNQITECEGQFSHANNVLYPNIAETALKVDELLESSDLLDPAALCRKLFEWLGSSQPDRHLAIFGIAVTAIEAALSVIGRKLDSCFVYEPSTPDVRPTKTEPLSVSHGWVFESAEYYPLLSCIPFGTGYVVWRLYQEDTSVPVLGLFDFVRNQGLEATWNGWLEENAQLRVAKIARELSWIESMYRFRACSLV